MNNQSISTNGSKKSAKANMQALLTFKVADQIYGLPIIDVARIIEMVAIISLPNLPDNIRGVINLHGTIVPVMDLRQRFGLPSQAYGLHTPIILTDTDQDGRMLGLVADSVEDVLSLPASKVTTTKEIMPNKLTQQISIHSAHLKSVAKIDHQIILVLNIDGLFTDTEQIQVSQAVEA